MDKFLAKKNPIFKQIQESTSSGGNQAQNNAPGAQSEKQDYVLTGFGLAHPDQTVRYRINGTILQLALKSMYENARNGVWS